VRAYFKKKFIFLFIILFCVTGLFLYFRAQYVVPIIMYHSIDDKADVSKLSVSPESFEAQMMFLKNRGYNAVKLEDLAVMVKENKIPYKTIAITFDDGFENNYTAAYPVLKELGISAAIFIIPEWIGKEGYLTWDQVVEMSDSGLISIGSHTMSHAYLAGIEDKRLEPEISDSKHFIEAHIGKEVRNFSYPLGAFDSDARDMVIKTGYTIAVATNPGGKYPKNDLFAMKRIRISRTSDNLFVFWIETSGFYTWIKEHRDSE
jgi:peptidoglycan/xylan/chitin deacetylase (PgdA/CDA1 family)